MIELAYLNIIYGDFMKQKLFFIFMFCILSVCLFADEGIQNKDGFLLDKIQKIESKKKDVLDAFENGRESRMDIIDETVRLFSDKKKEIDNAPYRAAELSEDGVTPSSFALQGRREAYNNFVNDKALQCKERIDSDINLTLRLDDINEYYTKIKNSSLSTLGNELVVSYDKYNGSSIGWTLNVSVKLSETEVFNTTSFLSYRDLTGVSPAKYGEPGFDEFCDKIDYYEDLFLTGDSPLVFEITCNVESKDESQPSMYEISFNDFKFYNKTDEYIRKKNLDLYSSYTEVQMTPVCDIREAYNYYSNLDAILIERQNDIKMKDLGLVIDPIILPKGTDGTYGTKGTYVLFGCWPQSKKAEDVVIDSDISNVITINDWYCYKGSDNNYYVSGDCPDCYYKLEPIKWRVLTDNYNGKCLLLAENALHSMSFGQEEYSSYSYSRKCINNYKNSDVRKWLNNTFLKSAFVFENEDKIVLATVDNSSKSTTDSGNNLREAYTFTSDDTMDKVFLLSENEVTRAEYGFAPYNENDNARLRKAVDYALPSNEYDTYDDYSEYDEYSEYDSYGNDEPEEVNVNSSWWLRSPYYDYKSDVRRVDDTGKADSYSHGEYSQLFVVPALTVSPEYLLPEDVSDLRFASGDRKITLSWTNPDSNNFDKVVISMKGFRDVEVKSSKGEVVTKTLSGLKTGREYEFTVKAVDKQGNISKGIKIKSLIKEVPPAEISDIFVIPGNRKITLSWTNPEDLDFEKVIISCTADTDRRDIVIKGMPGENKSVEIDGLTNNKPYKVTLNTSDKAGKISSGISMNILPSVTTDIPILLPKGTEGSYGTRGTYVLFGDWPQTVKTEDVIINTQEKEEINGWVCYKGSDDCYYVKVQSNPYDRFNFDYWGNCRSYQYGDDIYYSFDNNKKIEKNKEYYFKLEPIKWRLVTNEYEGGNLLVAENILEPAEFYSGLSNRKINNNYINDNNYKYSNIRAYLNGLNGSSYGVNNYSGRGFADKAFSLSASSFINTVNVDNSHNTATGYSKRYSKNYFCEDTKDKVFILSENDVNKNSYGFSNDNWNSNLSSRRRKTTDYARATGAYSSLEPGYNNCGWWWLRTPNYSGGSDDVCYVYAMGGTTGDEFSSDNYTAGVVPALVISSDFVSMAECSINLSPVPEVTELSALSLDGKISLSWKNPDYDNFDKSVISIGTFDFEIKEPQGAVVSKTLAGLKNSKKYKFTVKTVDKSGNISNGVSISAIAEDIAPEEVSGFDIMPADSSLIISWTTPDDRDFADVLISGLYPKDIKVGGGLSERNDIKINGLENDKTYTVTIKTVDKAGNISKGVSKDVMPGASDNGESEKDSCNEVSDVQVIPGDGSITLSWTNPGNYYFDKIIITGLNDSFIEVKGDKNESVTKEITGLENGTNYLVTIKTVNEMGVTSYGVSSDVTPGTGRFKCGYSNKDEYVK